MEVSPYNRHGGSGECAGGAGGGGGKGVFGARGGGCKCECAVCRVQCAQCSVQTAWTSASGGCKGNCPLEAAGRECFCCQRLPDAALVVHVFVD